MIFTGIGGRGAGADDRGNPELARDDGRVTGAAAAVRDDGGGPLHHRLPVRIGHVRDEHVARPHARHLLGALDHTGMPGADPLTDAAAADQQPRGGFQRVALDRAAGAALHRLGSRLKDVDGAGGPVPAPFDVHGRTIMILDDQRLLRQRGDVRIVQREAVSILRGHVDRQDPLGRARGGINHLDRLSAQIPADHGEPTRAQRRLVDVELVRIHSPLNDGFAESVGGGDEHNVAKPRIGVEGEHDARTAEVAADHVLHADGERHRGMIEAVVHPVGDRPVVEQRCVHLVHAAEQVFLPPHVQERFLLAGE